ncbi:S-layer homology domain-containing protein [Demequina flava]|uniref:CAP and S-layer homology domain-containing protein n=1 Tax=Demequina flava TaxID=1095025 RepID=UPI000782CB3D|nr:S-layer homology domain-containing protein [Demequina flava]
MRALVASALTALMLAVGLAAPASASSASESDHLIRETNAYRSSHGETQLATYSAMDWVPQKWSEWMLDNYMKHNPSYAKQLPQSGLRAMAENVAYSCGRGGERANADAVFNAWKNSSGHRKNILSSTYTHIAVGTAYDSKRDCLYATQNFAKYTKGSAPSLNTGTPFVDVHEDDQFADQIMWLADSGVTTGYSDGTFRPKDSVSREAFAAFMYRMAGSPRVSVPSRSPFKDVSTNAQFYKEIVWLANEGISTGWADGTFRPKDNISREAIAAFLYRYEGSPRYNAPSRSPFKDISTRAQFYDEVTWLRSTGITTGYADGTFRPRDSVTREATAAFFSRM